MENQFVPYELALTLKELGFKDECFGFYESLKRVGDGYCFNNYAMWGGISQNISESDDYHLYVTLNELYGYYDNILRAPLWQQAFDFLREKFDFHPVIYTDRNIGNDGGYLYEVLASKGEHLYGFTSYEQARLACLKKIIEIITL